MGPASLTEAEDTIKPPVTSIGVVGWIKSNLFNGWFNSILTLITVYGLYKIIPPFVRWAFIDSVWLSRGEACREAAGACWSIVTTNFRFILFGFYPYDLQWRPLVAMLLLFVLLFMSRYRRFWKKWFDYT